MAIEFRCEKCGAMNRAEAEPGSTMRCSNCDKRVAVPAGLALLPRPQVAIEPGLDQAPEPGTPGLEPEACQAEAVMGTMARAMPWVISVFFHVGLALITMFVAMVVVVRRPVPPGKTIPLATLHRERPGLRLVWPVEKRHQAPRTQYRRWEAQGVPGRKAPLAVSDPGETGKPLREIIGTGRLGGTGGKPRLLRRGGWLFEVGPGDGPDGPPGGPPGPGAYHIVYVIDRSGSMVEKMDAVCNEMLRSISRLDAQQDFHIILFAKGPLHEMPARRLVLAAARNKVAAADFLDNCRVGSQTDPIPALRRAFAVLSWADRRRPGRLIHFLSDGNFPDNAGVLAAVRTLNRDKSVCINTFLYGNRPPQAERVMKQIAAENGGQYKYVPEE